MKKLTAALLTTCMTMFAVFAEDVTARTIPQSQGIQVDAKAVIVMETMTGRVLFAQNESERLPIASTTKILTALIALEQPDVDAVFPVNEAAIMVEGSSMGLQKGDTASLRALAAGMLLASGNDAANAAAVRIAGSIPAFVGMMNERVKLMGLKDTNFATPSGLDGQDHYSTALDLAIIAREALRNNEFAAICSQYKMRASFGNPPYERWLTNHNKLLNYYEGAIGVKTGFTRKAGRCLVSAAQKDGVELICVTLGCPDDWNVHKAMYDRFFASVHIEDLAAGIPLITVPVTGGTAAEVDAVKLDRAQIPIPSGNVRIEYKTTVPPFVYAPVNKGQYLGETAILVDGGQVFRITLTAGADVPALHEYKEEKSILDIVKGIFGRD